MVSPYLRCTDACATAGLARSDAGADAYTHAAIDQAWRAVNELLGAVQGNDIS